MANLPIQSPIGVDVYSYTDTIPMSNQPALGGLESTEERVVMVDVNKMGTCFVTKDNENFQLLNDEVALITHKRDTRLHSNREFSGYIHFFKTGIRRALPFPPVSGRNINSTKSVILQPSVKEIDENLYLYDIQSGTIKNLTANIPRAKFPDELKFRRRFRVLAYLQGTKDAIVSDLYDLWRVDLDAKKQPVNITNGFGEANQIGFEVAQLNFEGDSKIIPPLKQAKLILTSFDYKNKDNDYYKISLTGGIKNPYRLTFGTYAYETTFLKGLVISGTSTMKRAKENDIYLFSRQNANHSLNLFITKDFRSVKQVSHVAPETHFNWLTSELIKFKGLNGQFLSGIFYKPTNFDPKRRYPVIVTYYSYKSQDLNHYYVPELQASAEPNIPFFVSNNYLVFVPDIPFILDSSYNSAMNSVIGAYTFLAQKPYVDTAKIGLAGHSHGGAETNFIVTHSDKFSAAVSGAGYSDLIGIYGFDPINKSALQAFLRGSVFNNLPDYVKYSSKLFADKLTTPLLLMHNRNDNTVPFLQSLSFFNTLWGLGKRAWLLQYDNEGHALWKDTNQLDFTIRMKQFFDHYLKDMPAPIWMTRGIGASKKGIYDGLNLDPDIKTPTR